MSSPVTPELPVFPVVKIHQEDGALLASAPGASPVTEALPEQWQKDPAALNRAGAAAATRIAAELGMDQIRVEIHTGTTTHDMWLQASEGALHSVGVTATEVAEQQQMASQSRKRQLRLMGIGGCLVVVLVIAAVVLRLNMKPSTQEVVLPQPAQLPVAAPAGWDTYAVWAVPATADTGLVFGDRVVYAEGSHMKSVDSVNGAPVGQADAGFKITHATTAAGVAGLSLAVSGSSGDVAVGSPESLHRVSAPTTTAKLSWVSGVPVWVSGTSVWVPDGSGNLSRYTIPAGAEPAAIAGAGVWVVSKTEPKAWHITSDSAVLPTPVVIPAPASGGDFAGPVASVGDRLAVKFTPKKGSGATVLNLRIKDDSLTDPWAVKTSVTGSAPVTDPARHMVLADGLLIDLKEKKAMVVGTNATYGAGFAWTTGKDPKRVSATGEVLDWPAGSSTSTAAVPTGITSQNQAVVTAKENTSTGDGFLYVLSPAAGTPAASQGGK